MAILKSIVLDVLKPHHPNGLEFAAAIADSLSDAEVTLDVVEVDEKTETVTIAITGSDLAYAQICEAIGRMSGSVHSIDQVEVHSTPPEA